MARYITLSRENQFQFTCPTFNAKTKMAACMVLRERVWAGFKPDKRQGCQVAMTCGMCPAAAIVERIGRQLTSDDYGSLEPKVGRLHADVLERIRRTIPIPSVLDKAPITPEERQLLLTTRVRIEEQLKTAPGRDGKPTPHIAPQKIESTIAPSNSVGKRGRERDNNEVEIAAGSGRHLEPNQNKINRAAASGDMAAALNAA